MKRAALGGGLDALIPTSLDLSNMSGYSNEDMVKSIKLDCIVAGNAQPRERFDQAELDQLAASIKSHGILQPILVNRVDNQKYQIIAGERRYRAARIAGLSEVPCIIKNTKNQEELEIALIENVQRVNLNPIEQARTYKLMNEILGMKINQISERIGKSESTISNSIRLLKLPDDCIGLLEDGLISEGHARALLSLIDDEVNFNDLLKKIIQNGYSVRQSEDFVKKINSPKKIIQSETTKTNPIDVSRLSTRLNAKVVIKKNKNGGSIIIKFKNEDEYNRLLNQL